VPGFVLQVPQVLFLWGVLHRITLQWQLSLCQKTVKISRTVSVTCGKVTFKFQRKNFIPLIKKRYELYFGCNVGDEEGEFWTPHICCATCGSILNGWKNGSWHIPVAVPMVSGKPEDHSSDCYFYLTDISGISSKSKYMVTYPNVPSPMRSVPHSDQLPVPKPPNNVTMDKVNSDADEVHPDQVGERMTMIQHLNSGPSSITIS